MRKTLFFLLLSPLWLFAKEPVEFIAGTISTKNGLVEASEGVEVLYQSSYMSAKRATYNKKEQLLELFGNVRLLKGERYYMLGDYISVDLGKKEQKLEGLFLQDKNTKVWISATHAEAKDERYILKQSMVSGCSPDDPKWMLRFDEGVYNLEDRWIELYDATLDIGDLSLIYLPYISFPLDRTRRSGLLRPRIGISADEGIFYEQPIYFAPSASWDLEFIPQIRTDRGYGSFAKFRFVDSPTSQGWIGLGAFKEKKKYKEKYSLENSVHSGFELFYDRRHLFDKKVTGEDGLFIDLHLIDDADFYNLQAKDDYETQTSTIITSRLNYFLEREADYFGAYAKYFIDVSKQSNSDTLQLLPSLQYHRFSRVLNDFNLMYSFDYRYKNHYRKSGVGGIQQEVRVPIHYSKSLFDDFLQVDLSQTFYLSTIRFDDTTNFVDNNGLFLRNNFALSVSSDLIKPYKNLLHTLHLDVTYSKPEVSLTDGFYDEENRLYEQANCKVGEPCEFSTFERLEEQVSFVVDNFFYDKSGSELLYHRLKQVVYVDRSYNDLEVLQSELRYRVVDKLSLFNDIFYNHDYAKISRVATVLSYDNEDIALDFSHIYQDNLSHKANYIRTRLDYSLNDRYKTFGFYTYDYEEREARNWGFGFSMNRRCWGYSIGYREETRPILTKNGAGSIFDKTLFFQLHLLPLGGFGYDYTNSDLRG